MATQEERRRSTRRRLVETARRHFVDHGYAETSTAAILSESGVSRGAMYHHYSSKQELFADVYEEVARAAIRRAVAGPPGAGSHLGELVRVCLAWLREARRPEVASIVLEQGPAVLGLERAREIEARYSLGGIEDSLRRAEDAGEIRVVSRAVTARLLNAMLGEAALLAVASGGGKTGDDTKIESQIENTVREWILGLALAAGPGQAPTKRGREEE